MKPGLFAIFASVTVNFKRMELISLLEGRLRIAPEGFGDYYPPVVHQLLKIVYNRVILFSGVDAESLFPVLVSRTFEEVPMIVRYNDFHNIQLATEGRYWCQWVYQFAHEMCHHVLGGSLSGDITGQIWFEETLCEVSSLHQLYCVGVEDSCNFRALSQLVPMVRDYLDGYRNTKVRADILGRIQSRTGIRPYLGLLSKPSYNREIYRCIAVILLPLFQENPNLWRILRHIGDSRRYGSLREWLLHLRDIAEPEYRDSLGRMIGLLLP